MNSSQGKSNSVDSSEFQENLALLREIIFFTEFPLEMLKVFAYLCTREMYMDGDLIFSQDDDDGRAYCILSGEAALSRRYEDKEMPVRRCGRNSFFGAFTLACKVNRLFSLTALTETSCLVLTRDDFQEIIAQFKGSRQNMINGLTENIVLWEEKFLNRNIGCDSCRSLMGVSLL